MSANFNSSQSSKDWEEDLDVEEMERKKVQSRTFVRLMAYTFKHRSTFVLGLFAIFGGTAAALLEPRIFGYAIDEAILPKRWTSLKAITGVFFSVTCLRIFSAIQQGYLFELLGQKVTQDLRLKLFSHLQRMPVSLFDKNPAGRLLTRVTNDIAALNEMFSAGFVSMICNVLLVVGILVGMLTLDFKLGLIAVSVFPFMIVASVYFSGKLRIAYRDSRSKLSALNAFLAENFSGMKIVHLFNRQSLHISRFEKLNQRYAEAQTGSTRVFALFQPMITLSAGVSIAFIIWFGGREALRGELKLGVLVAYFTYAMSLFQPMREIADKWNVFLSGMASAERVFAVLDWETELDPEAALKPVQLIQDLKGHIVFEDVWFAYEGESWVLKELSFEIKPGERVGIVGHTGAGKSSLISLLMRFYEPQRGRILLDGKDLRSYDKRSLRASIGLVQQDVFLFSGSFADNIHFWENANPDTTHAILANLNFNYDDQSELLQERGSNFSMGERQVIAFARAMSANPKIWILDEATANMDSEHEAVLQKCLETAAYRGNCAGVPRTEIIIAHRLATVGNMDRILVLHKGRLMESGSHDDLIGLKGLYARLYNYQQAQSPLRL